MLVISFLVDHNVPDSVANFLRERGHKVVLVREIMPTNSPDQLVAATSELSGAILLSCDRDFRQIARRILPGAKMRFKRLSRISLFCDEPKAAARIEEAIELIEFEFAQAQKRTDKRVFIVIQNEGIKTHR